MWKTTPEKQNHCKLKQLAVIQMAMQNVRKAERTGNYITVSKYEELNRNYGE
jgi:hypothetical protein